MQRFGGLQQLWEQFRASYCPEPLREEKTTRQAYLVSSIEEDTPPVAVFGRDERTGSQVWSGDHGYPGDGWYLDFHKKHFPGGHRYWRVTSPQTDLGGKALYEPQRASERVPENADHFCSLVHELLTQPQADGTTGGVICAPYDAELFGHWWFEGPEWLYRVIKGLQADHAVATRTCAAYLDQAAPETAVALPESSWGQGGFHWIWLNEWTNWIWRDIYEAEADFPELARNALTGQNELVTEVVRQAGRELLLLEASDWPFLISTWSARDYAERRAGLHRDQFQRLIKMARQLLAGMILTEEDEAFLAECRRQDALFPDLDLSWWVQVEHPAAP
jgi:1,4-alpha-glucan branching enzyme